MPCKLVVFDLDGTLAPSKCPMDNEMSGLLAKLLEVKSVAVISGGSYNQFQKQFLASLICKKELLSNLFLFPTCSTSFYRFVGKEWVNIYSHLLSDDEKIRIRGALAKVLNEAHHAPEKIYGEIVEDRGTQITFSALGQQAPLEAKQSWDPTSSKRQGMKKRLEKIIPEFEIRIGGTTSIDITRKGIDKKYGIWQIQKQLGFAKEEILFVGDALFEGGNDYPVRETGVECISVKDPGDTKKVILDIISAA